MARPKVSCFVSYCHEDVDRAVLAYLRLILSEHSDQHSEIMLDSDLPYGSDIPAFMAHLDTVDAVLILLSPAYKRKVLSRKGGVYEEYKRIMHRFHSFNEKRQGGKKPAEIPGYFELLPVLFSGTQNDSIPEELLNLRYLNLVGLSILRGDQGEFLVTDHIRKRYVPEIKKLSTILNSLYTLKSKQFQLLYEEYYSRLFLELKADWENPRHHGHNYPDSLFVKTRAYRRIQRQESLFAIGRKGSGKSTIADMMAIRQADRYKGRISIVADELNLALPYAFFNTPQVISDTQAVLPRLRCFQLAWEAFFFICAIELLLHLEAQGHLTAKQSALLPPLADFHRNLCGAPRLQLELEPKNRYFTYAFDSITRFLRHSIDTASRDDPRFFHSDIQGQFTTQRFLDFCLGGTVVESFLSILAICKRKFLITLDGFDTAFDLFRRDSITRAPSEDLTQRVLFEVDWLRSLMLLVLEFKQSSTQMTRFHELMEYCITVPKDRFFEVLRTDRDRYRYNNRFTALDWSGIELAILVRKRLEELSQYSTVEERKPEERLAEVWNTSFSHIPWEITVDTGNRRITVPLFMCVLRNSFWRPRDVLLHYARIIALAEEIRKKGYKINSEAIASSIQVTAFDIIESEFINEFESTVLNVRQIINSFRKRRYRLSFPEVAEILAKLDFRLAAGSVDPISVEDKIDFLYQIGFLGVQGSDEERTRLRLQHRDVFSFNEGYAILRMQGEGRYSNMTFLVHPIFEDYLELERGGDVLLDLNWEYLHLRDSLASTSSGSV
jgi:energy-coupling factor transporter ATP-binding protein EcfA2